MKVIAYTDGACSGNPGAGGWGVFVQAGEEQFKLSGSAAHTTNNKMELQAAISALEFIAKMKNKPSEIEVYTDSTYVKNGIEDWVHNWKKRSWRTASNKPVKNQDLWKKLDELAQMHRPTWHWVKGHSGDFGNDMADKLACEAIRKQ